MPKRNQQLLSNCPFEAAMEMIGGKWKGVILFKLMKGTQRFSELKSSIPMISQRMLTQQLRELEANQLITRKIYTQIPPKVEYSLTPMAKRLEPLLLQFREWGLEYKKYVASVK